MIRLTLDLDSLARVRVAGSPLFETVAWLGLVVSGRHHPVYGDPGPVARFTLRDRDVAAAAVLTSDWVPRCYVPDFLTPKPRAGSGVMTDQLERLRNMPIDAAMAEIASHRWSSSRAVAQRGLQEGNLLGRVATGLAKFWQQVLAEESTARDRMLDADVSRLGHIAARQGIGAMLDRLHPQTTWDDGSLTIHRTGHARHTHASTTVSYRNRELVLVPSLLTLRHVSLRLDDLDDSFIVFPSAARHRPQPIGDVSAAFLGRGRGRVLESLRSPSTTRLLAGRLGRSESTISHHLQALVNAGLIEGSREGRQVVYALTDAGRRLVDELL